MPRVQLTRRFIETARCLSGRPKVDFFDTSQRGLMLEVRASGGKTFYQRYTDDHGRERQFKIGPADVITLEQARRQARTIFAHAVLGDDPQARRRELRATPTIAAFVHERYLPHVKTYKRSWQTDETVLRIHILPTLGNLAADEATTGRSRSCSSACARPAMPAAPPTACWCCCATSTISGASGRSPA